MEDNSSSLTINQNIIAETDLIYQSEAIFQFATEGILIVDEQGKIIRANPNCEILFGYGTSELENKTIEELIPNRFSQNHIKHRNNFNHHSRARSMGTGVDLFAKRKDETEFQVEVSLSPYRNSKGSYVIAFIIDITVRKIAEYKLISYKNELEVEIEERTLILKEAILKLEKTKEELDKALKREQEVNLMKSQFITLASHEFRTPLTTILSSLSLVEKYADLNEKEMRNKHIARIKSSIRNLTDILNDFLSLDKLEEGKVGIITETFNLNKLLEDICLQMNGITKQGQGIYLAYLTKDISTVCLDPKIIKNIIINLVSNAIKFSPVNSAINITTKVLKTKIFIKVKDKGIGIPKSEQKHVFERFYRMNNAIDTQGTGLGLSIVYQYITLLKGKITFTSEVNKGTEFKLTFPRYL